MKNNKKKLIITIAVVVIVLLVVVIACAITIKNPSKEPVDIMEEVTDESTKEILEKQLPITFGTITPTGKMDTDYYVEYTIENLTKNSYWCNYQVDAYDASGNVIGSGAVTENDIPANGKVENKFILVLTTDAKVDMENVTVKVTKAYSQKN